MENIKKLLKGVDEFPTLPTIYTTLSDVMANPRSTVNQAADIISRDQASAMKVLKTANSSIYGFRGKIDSISQAIFYIGFEEVKNLVIALSVIDLFSNTKSTHNFNPVELWKHSIAVGVITRIIGTFIGAEKVENYFISGILHDIGKLLFINSLPKEYSKAVNYAFENNMTIRDAEAEILGVTHTVAGELVAEKWKLPLTIRESIRNHYSGMVNNKPDKLTSCVHIANIIAHCLEFGSSGDEIIQEPNLEALKSLDLPNDIFTVLLPKITSDYDESLVLFQLN